MSTLTLRVIKVSFVRSKNIYENCCNKRIIEQINLSVPNVDKNVFHFSVVKNDGFQICSQ